MNKYIFTLSMLVFLPATIRSAAKTVSVQAEAKSTAPAATAVTTHHPPAKTAAIAEQPKKITYGYYYRYYVHGIVDRAGNIQHVCSTNCSTSCSTDC